MRLPAADAAPPQVLPKVTVSADVPLIKVAEFRMRERRFAPAAVAHKDSLYIIGGLVSDGNLSNSIERLDVRTGQSEIVARLRIPRLWHRAVVVGDKIYVLGGMTTGIGATDHATHLESAMRLNRRVPQIVEMPMAQIGLDVEDSVEIVDLVSGTVSPGPKMPDPRSQFACVKLGGSLYVVGGRRVFRGKLSCTNTTEILDLAQSNWRQGAPMPTAQETDGAVVDGGFIVVAGGYTGLHPTSEVNVYDPRDGTWRTITPLCRSTSAHAVVFFGSYLFLFGDYETPERLLAYNLKTKQSEIFTLGYTAARHTAAVVNDGRFYVVGGKEIRDSDPLDLIQVFAPTKSAERRP